jgi:hypothetical protein
MVIKEYALHYIKSISISFIVDVLGQFTFRGCCSGHTWYAKTGLDYCLFGLLSGSGTQLFPARRNARFQGSEREVASGDPKRRLFRITFASATSQIP